MRTTGAGVAIDPTSVRFGGVDLMTGAMALPLLGLLLTMIPSLACGHRWMRRFDITVIKAVATQVVQIVILRVLLRAGARAARVRKQAISPEENLVLAGARDTQPR
jgi:hypothetical protein